MTFNDSSFHLILHSFIVLTNRSYLKKKKMNLYSGCEFYCGNDTAILSFSYHTIVKGSLIYMYLHTDERYAFFRYAHSAWYSFSVNDYIYDYDNDNIYDTIFINIQVSLCILLPKNYLRLYCTHNLHSE